MSVTKIITLTNKGNNAGPYYEVSCSNDCVTYSPCLTTGSIYLPTIGSTANVNIYDTTTCIKLVNYNGDCNNEVTHDFPASGSTTTTSTTSTTSTTTTTTYAPLITSGLVSWLSCDSLSGSVWYDKSPNNNNALVSGSALTQSGSLGIAFNGTNNYLTYTQPITNQPVDIYTYQFYGTLPLTGASEWMFVNGTGPSTRQGLIWSPTTSQFVWIGSSAAAITVSVASAEKAVWTILLDWNFGGFEIFKNGTSVGYTAASVYKFDNYGGFEFGYLQGTDSTATYFAGAAQDLIVYNRRLSNAEITTNYNYLTHISCNSTITTTTTTTTTIAPTTTTTTTIAPTTTTTTVIEYDYYLAEEYSCDTCTFSIGDVPVVFPAGTSIVTSNRYYKPIDFTGQIYKNFVSTSPGVSLILTTTGNSTSCPTICGSTTTTTAGSTTTTTTAAPTLYYYNVTRYNCFPCGVDATNLIASSPVSLVNNIYYNNGDGYVYYINYGTGAAFVDVDLSSSASDALCNLACSI